MNVESAETQAAADRTSPRILLISANPNLPTFVSPYGLEVLAATAVQHLGAEVRITDPFLRIPFSRPLNRLLSEFRPHIIGIGMRNLDVWFGCNHDSRQVEGRTCVPEVAKIARFLLGKGFPSDRIVLGGAGFSVAPLALLEECGLRYGVVGAGGMAFVGFVRASLAGRNPGAIPGVLARDGPKTSASRIGIGDELNVVPVFSSPHRFLLRRRHLPFPLRTRSGCGYLCSYCCEGRSQPRPVAVRRLDSLRMELEHLKRQGAERVMLADGEFNQTPLGHAEAVIRLIREFSFSWRAYALPKTPSDSFLSLLEGSRCESLLLTVDSFSPAVLGGVGRPVDPEAVGRALERYCLSGVDIQASVIFGLPGETDATLNETLHMIRSFPSIQFNYTCGPRIYANTPLFEHSRSAGAGHVYGAGTDHPLEVSLYCEPAPPWEVENLVRRSQRRIPNLAPLWASVERPGGTSSASLRG